MKINVNTKIAALLKHHPDVLEVIVGLSPKFGKLRNPLLRKLLAGRTTIAMASKVGGCGVNDFFKQLAPLGFEAEEQVQGGAYQKAVLPVWLLDKTKQEIKDLDVRPVLKAGQDPLKQILIALRGLPKGQVLKIINTFEPTPLILMLEKKGYGSYVESPEEDLVFTYFYKKSGEQEGHLDLREEGEGWDQVNNRFKDRLVLIDVRHLPMPQPMMTILAALEKLPPDQALLVEHKKTPLFLLSELRERGFDYRIREIEEQHVQLIIFRYEEKY